MVTESKIRSIEELKNLVGEYDLPQSIGWSKKKVITLASEMAESVGFKPGGDILEIVKANGGRIRYCNIPELADIDGTVFIHGDKDFDILLPMFTGPWRDRFTIAHEIGHYVLHTGDFSRQIYANRHNSDRAEWEANWFAAGFLMPDRLLDETIQAYDSNPSLIASYFGVSTAAADVRLKSRLK